MSVKVHSLWLKASVNPATHAKQVKLSKQHSKSHSITTMTHSI